MASHFLPISSAELLPHLGGLQLQGHEAALPAKVRLLRAPWLGRGGGSEDTSPQALTVHLPGPLCWLLWPSWMPSRKWPTWPPTPEVGRGTAGGRGEGAVGPEPGVVSQGEDTGPRVGTLSSPSQKGLAVEKVSLSSLEAASRIGGQGCHGGFRSCCGAPLGPLSHRHSPFHSASLNTATYHPLICPQRAQGQVSLPCWLWRLLCFLV